MRFSAVVAILGAVVSVSASTLVARQFPACSVTCLSNGPIGDCQATDNSCLCKNTAFIANVTSCIETSCEGADLQTALTGAQALCAAVGVTLTAESSTPAASSTGSEAATTKASATTTGSTTGASTSGASTATTTSGAITHGLSAAAGIAAFALAAIAL